MISSADFLRLRRMAVSLRRFGEKLKVDTSTGCWNWTAGLTSTGYGQAAAGVKAHRRMMEFVLGDLRGLHVLHRCVGNRRCVNPEHLYLGTDAENTADKMRQGRHRPRGPGNNGRRGKPTPWIKPGETHPAAKWTDSEIAEMIVLVNSGNSVRSVASRFHIDESYLCKLRRGFGRAAVTMKIH